MKSEIAVAAQSIPVPELPTGIDPAWLPRSAWRPLGSRRVAVVGDGLVLQTIRGEVAAAVAVHGGELVPVGWSGSVDLELVCSGESAGLLDDVDSQGFEISRSGETTVVVGRSEVGLLYGMHHIVRLGDAAFVGEFPAQRHVPRQARANARPLGQHDRSPGDGPGRKRLCGGVAVLSGRRRSHRPEPGHGLRQAARFDRGQPRLSEQRQRRSVCGATADRPTARRRPAGRGVPAIRDPGAALGQLRGADHAGRIADGRSDRSRPCSVGGTRPRPRSTRPSPISAGTW